MSNIELHNFSTQYPLGDADLIRRRVGIIEIEDLRYEIRIDDFGNEVYWAYSEDTTSYLEANKPLEEYPETREDLKKLAEKTLEQRTIPKIK